MAGADVSSLVRCDPMWSDVVQMHSRTIFLTCFLVSKILLIVTFLLPTSGKNWLLPAKTGFRWQNLFLPGRFLPWKKPFFPSSSKNLPILRG